jgi:hypothetical protein|tara:strand:- start:438 stop:665 length:228 start_codon:yes stop_codon:yes gene_type:complete
LGILIEKHLPDSIEEYAKMEKIIWLVYTTAWRIAGANGHSIRKNLAKENSEFEIPERERAIAHVARAVHDYFIFE